MKPAFYRDSSTPTVVRATPEEIRIRQCELRTTSDADTKMKKGAYTAPFATCCRSARLDIEQLWRGSSRNFRQVLDRVVLVVLHLGFVFDDLTIQLVNQRVDRSI